MKIRLASLERIFAVFTLLMMTSAFIPLYYRVAGLAPEVAEGKRMAQAVFLAVYVITVILIAYRRIPLLHMLSHGRLVWLLVGLATLSVFWSASPAITIRRSIALVGTSLFAIYLAARFTNRQILHLLAWTLGIAAVMSLLTVLALPHYGVESAGWRGIYIQKNHLGRMMALGAWIFALIAMEEKRHRKPALILLLLCVLLVIASNSKTALVVMILMGPLVLGLRILQQNASPAGVFLSAILFLGSLVAGAALILWQSIVAQLDPSILTLTGRTELWAAMLAVISEQMWLGYGYGAFWTGANGPSGDVWFYTVSPWSPLHGHSGYLDLMADLGLVGLTLFVLGYFWYALLAVFNFSRTRGIFGIFPLFILAFIAIYSTTETVVLVRNSIFLVLYFVVVLKLSMAYRIRMHSGQYKRLRRVTPPESKRSPVLEGPQVTPM